MVRGFRLLAIAGLCVVASPPLQADETAPTTSSGFYVLGRLGTALPIEQDTHTTISGVPGAPSLGGKYDPESGFGVEAAVGKYLGDGWRAEVSYKWLRGTDGTLEFDGAPGFAFQLDGNGESHTVLLNAYKTLCSFDTMFGTISPFVGAGIGFSVLDITDISFQIFPGSPFLKPGGDGTDTVFAAAAHAGYDMVLAPGVTLTSQWSLQYAEEATFRGQFFGFIDTSRDAQVQISTFTGIRIDLN